MTLALVLFARAPVDGNWLVDVLPATLAIGLGGGIAFNPLLLAAMSGVEPQESGLASGVVNTAFMMGGALGLAVLASTGRLAHEQPARLGQGRGRRDERRLPRGVHAGIGLPHRVCGRRGLRAPRGGACAHGRARRAGHRDRVGDSAAHYRVTPDRVVLRRQYPRPARSKQPCSLAPPGKTG